LKNNKAKSEALIASGIEHLDKVEYDAAIADFSGVIHIDSKKITSACSH
jgi:hypothetical protein